MQSFMILDNVKNQLLKLNEISIWGAFSDGGGNFNISLTVGEPHGTYSSQWFVNVVAKKKWNREE